MPELSLGWTLPALLAGRKTCCRQTWGQRGPGKLRAGSVVPVYAGAPREVLGRRRRRLVALVRLTHDPELQPLGAMPDSDYDAEGWRWLHDHPEALRSPRITCADFSWEAFERWRARSGASWVVRFEVLHLLLQSPYQAPPHAPHAPPHPPPQPPSPGGATVARRVLVVEDDAAIRGLVAEVLRGEGYAVETAGDGAAGLVAALSWRPAAILLDYQMPLCDGATFAALYRATVPVRAPIILITAAPDAARRAAQLKAADVLPKPFDLSHLLQLVARHATPHAPAAHDRALSTSRSPRT
ncbi:MAG TPA: response regulator [Chloroflexota bacterium]|nr:response regulator [Chloroflexota bacterium]